MNTTTKPKTRLVEFGYDGFHGYTELAVRVPVDAKPGDEIELSDRVARRLDHAVCGGGGCQCHEGVTSYFSRDNPNASEGNYFVVPEKDGTIRGGYPQQS